MGTLSIPAEWKKQKNAKRRKSKAMRAGMPQAVCPELSEPSPRALLSDMLLREQSCSSLRGGGTDINLSNNGAQVLSLSDSHCESDDEEAPYFESCRGGGIEEGLVTNIGAATGVTTPGCSSRYAFALHDSRNRAFCVRPHQLHVHWAVDDASL